MCGIAGIFHLNGKKNSKADIKQMTDRIAYRGPDAEGQWLSVDGALGLGHRRLSILDLSEAGSQPMHYGDGRYTITFNGEIYNYIEIREVLEKKGHRFRTGTDTEVLLALYAEKKENCLADLDGMFAFAIWDNVEKVLFCCRDRFGEKPFYYGYEPGQRFVFGSEMKCLFQAGFSKEAHEARLYSYLANNVAEDPYDLSTTFYKHITQLEPAHYLKISKDRVLEKKCYWRLKPEAEMEPPPTFEIARRRYYELFETSVRRRMRSDVPIGTCLSGGLDSSSIAVLLDKLLTGSPTPLKTFSARMPNQRMDEGPFMQQVIAKTHVEPHFVWQDPDKSISELDDTFYHNEEPLLWSAVLTHRMVMRLAKENKVPVLIDGQGPDEVLAGYVDSFGIYFRELYLNNPSQFASELNSYRGLQGKQFKAGLKFRLDARFPEMLGELSAISRHFLNAHHLRDLNSERAARHKDDRLPFPRFTRLNDSLRYATTVRGLSYLLRMCDRNSMAFAIEVRLPYLFHELVEFSFSLPPSYKIHDGWSKYILRKSMEHLLPPAIAWRRDKIGFETPQREWMNHPKFKERIEDAISVLKKEKWIKEPIASKGWQYIFAAKVIKNDL